jgi:hypothetical protein
MCAGTANAGKIEQVTGTEDPVELLAVRPFIFYFAANLGCTSFFISGNNNIRSLWVICLPLAAFSLPLLLP